MANKKVKVRVLKAVVDGYPKGSIISIDERSAKNLEKNHYVERVAGNAKLFDARQSADNEAEDGEGDDGDGGDDGGDTGGE